MALFGLCLIAKCNAYFYGGGYSDKINEKKPSYDHGYGYPNQYFPNNNNVLKQYPPQSYDNIYNKGSDSSIKEYEYKINNKNKGPMFDGFDIFNYYLPKKSNEDYGNHYGGYDNYGPKKVEKNNGRIFLNKKKKLKFFKHIFKHIKKIST